MNKPLLKWSPAVPVRVKDNLISSAAREKNQGGFTPSYESDSRQYMNFLMSNEYMRVWFKERGKYEKDIYSREQTIKEESKIKRRVVQRMMTYRRPLKNDFIDDVINKTSKKPVPESQEVTLKKMKYRPDCMGRKKKSATTKTAKTTGPSATAGASPDQAKEKSKAKDKIKKGAEDDDDACTDSGEVVILCADTTENTECCEDSK